jgi:hypothetical protein
MVDKAEKSDDSQRWPLIGIDADEMFTISQRWALSNGEHE